MTSIRKIFTNSPSTLTFCLLQKNDLNNLFMVRLQLIRMSSYAKNKVQMCSVTQHQCRRRQKMWGKFSQIHPLHSLLSDTKNDLSWLNNLFTVRFQLIRMSSYAKNKLQMCSVTQHQCRRRQMLGKFSQIHPDNSLLSVTKNDLSWLNNLFTVRLQLIRMSSYDILRTNYVNRLFSQDKSFL